MANHSRSTRVCTLFDTALQTYEKNVGVALAEHPLALRLQSCQSVESVITVLQDQVLSDLRGSDRVIKSIKSTVSILTKLSTATSPALDIGLVRQKALMMCSPTLTVLQPFPPVAIIYIGLAILISVCTIFWCLYKYSCDVQGN